MSQDVRSRQATANSTSSTSPVQPWGQTFGAGVVTESGNFSVESYADRLMNELFGDVEQALEMPQPLETTVSAAGVPATPEPSPQFAAASAQSAEAPPEQPRIALPLAITPHSYESADLEAAASELVTTPASEASPNSNRFYDRLLIAVGCLSLIVTLAAWLLTQEMRRPVSAPVASVPPTAAAEAQTNSSFGQYVDQALRAIDERTKPPSNPNGVLNGATNSSLPTVAVPKAPTAPPTVQPNGSQTAPKRSPLERVYIPTYQFPPNFIPKRAAMPNAAPLAPIAPGQAPIVTLPIPGVQAPTVARTLKGVVEMGDKSAALIEIGGVVQSFRLGESIGSSGWSLVEVSKDRAVLRRNGEVRSISVEQSF